MEKNNYVLGQTNSTKDRYNSLPKFKITICFLEPNVILMNNMQKYLIERTM